SHVCIIYCLFVLFFFFFQAEDGIRDFHVTGVQTCALPISTPVSRKPIATGQKLSPAAMPALAGKMMLPAPRNSAKVMKPRASRRSEERRVGKGGELGGGRITKKKRKRGGEEEREGENVGQ